MNGVPFFCAFDGAVILCCYRNVSAWTINYQYEQHKVDSIHYVEQFFTPPFTSPSHYRRPETLYALLFPHFCLPNPSNIIIVAKKKNFFFVVAVVVAFILLGLFVFIIIYNYRESIICDTINEYAQIPSFILFFCTK